MKMVLSRNILVENSGFVIDKNNYVLGATPDAKITDTNATSLFGIAEVQCTEEYKDIHPKDICYISNLRSSAYPMIQILERLLSTEITDIMIRCKRKLPCQHKHGVILFFTPLRIWLLIAYHSTVFIGKI